MHPATIQSLAGMLGIIRQACIGIEAVMSAEIAPALAKNQTLRDNSQSSGQETQYLNEDEEAALAKVFGMNTNE